MFVRGLILLVCVAGLAIPAWAGDDEPTLSWSCSYLKKQLDYSKRAFSPEYDENQVISFPVRDALESLLTSCSESVSDRQLKSTIEEAIARDWRAADDDTPLTVFVLSFRWCGPCRSHYKKYAKIARKHGFARFVLVDGDAYGDDARMDRFIEKLTTGSVQTYPGFFLADENGLVKTLTGFRQLSPALRQLESRYTP